MMMVVLFTKRAPSDAVPLAVMVHIPAPASVGAVTGTEKSPEELAVAVTVLRPHTSSVTVVPGFQPVPEAVNVPPGATEPVLVVSVEQLPVYRQPCAPAGWAPSPKATATPPNTNSALTQMPSVRGSATTGPPFT